MRTALAALLLATVAVATAAGERVHGASDRFADSEVRLVWGVLRGPDETATRLVIRVHDPLRRYRHVALDGIDPFTQARTRLVPPQALNRIADLDTPRAGVADWPSREVRLYRDDAELRADTPALAVYWLGVPDTTPEYADRAGLEARLGR
ncbi:MAG: hypothetical protein FJX46_06730 [Alphaproteobacteria bacterium]|nr:hypothetical protein [Alphaproteobacteria bacterium]